MRSKEISVSQKKPAWPGGWFLAGAALILLCFFWKCALPDYVHFSNDGPLGLRHSESYQTAGLSGIWYDLNWLGINGAEFPPDLTYVLHGLLSPEAFAKWYPAISLLCVGFGAWLFFRKSKLAAAACALGGLAAMLNSDFFSTSCWGVCSQTIGFGFDFLALAALADSRLRWWLKVILAGLAVGVNVMEAFDIGAIFSVLVAAFAFWQYLVAGEGGAAKRIVTGVARVAGVAVFAMLIAVQTVVSLVHTQIQGVTGMRQTEAAKAQQWNEATQWSLPKCETLALIVPGLFGNRMDTPGGGNYWGAVGRDASWNQYFHGKLREGDAMPLMFPDEPNLSTNLQVEKDGSIAAPLVGPVPAAGLTEFELQQKLDDLYASTSARKAVIQTPPGFLRYTGGGNYLGVLVALVALWTTLQSLRKENSVFSLRDRQLIWFWSVVAVIALLLAWGRYAPFYRVLYSLPYASTVRNPAKFLHVVTFAVVVLFAYGVDGLYRRYWNIPLANFPGFGARFKNWRTKASAFERRWLAGCMLAVAAALAGWIVYAASRGGVEKYLQEVQFGEDMAHSIAGFSIAQVGWFVLFLALSVAVLTLVFTGALAGRRGKWGAILIGAVLLADFARANSSWIIFWNYKQKYETYGPDPVVKFLMEKPYEHRVIKLPLRWPDQFSLFSNLYDIEWIQQIFQYWDVQSLDIVQWPRMPEEVAAFRQVFPPVPVSMEAIRLFPRQWELANVRYLLGPVGYLPLLNEQLDPAQHRFRMVSRFTVVPKPGVEHPMQLSELTAESATNGEYALMEFTGALPRAKLYSHWQIETNDETALSEMTSPKFDPHQTVLVAAPAPACANSTNAGAGMVEITKYLPRDIVLKADAAAPAVLLLNDKYDPDWQVLVDGKRSDMLRCNYVARGVSLAPGEHMVEFQFKPSTKWLPVSLGAIALGVILLGYAVFAEGKFRSADEKIS